MPGFQNMLQPLLSPPRVLRAYLHDAAVTPAATAAPHTTALPDPRPSFTAPMNRIFSPFYSLSMYFHLPSPLSAPGAQQFDMHLVFRRVAPGAARTGTVTGAVAAAARLSTSPSNGAAAPPM